MSVAFAILAVVAVLATLTVTWEARRAAGARLALGGAGAARHRAVVRGEALFATGIDRSTVSFDCLMTTGHVPDASLEPTSLTLRGRAPSWAGQTLADVIRSWAEGGERVFVEVPVDSLFGPRTARLTCGHHGLQVEVADGGELRRLISRHASPLTWPR